MTAEETIAEIFEEQLPLAAMADGWMFEEAAETFMAALSAKGFAIIRQSAYNDWAEWQETTGKYREET